LSPAKISSEAWLAQRLTRSHEHKVRREESFGVGFTLNKIKGKKKRHVFTCVYSGRSLEHIWELGAFDAPHRGYFSGVAR
jgi:predicted NUDIX family phosphoesterase